MYAIHIELISPVDHRQDLPLISRQKGNPMTDNARPVPGSTRSRRAASCRFVARALALCEDARKSVQNPYKSDHFCKQQFFNCYTSATCNFNALKCTDFHLAVLILLLILISAFTIRTNPDDFASHPTGDIVIPTIYDDDGLFRPDGSQPGSCVRL